MQSLLNSESFGEYGVVGNASELDHLESRSPVLSKSGKSLVTFNQTGFDTQSRQSTWVMDDILNSLAPGHRLLDIGCGFGAALSRALATGVRVVANDCSLDHLLCCREDIPQNLRENLFLRPGSFPDIAFPDSSFDAVLAHRVLHFLSGEQIEMGLSMVGRWLKPGGLLGIALLSASHVGYRSWFKPKYDARYRAGNPWPGEWLKVAQGLPAQAYALPDRLHVMEPNELARAVEGAGFKIVRCDYVSMVDFGTESNRDGQEHAGIIASWNPD